MTRRPSARPAARRPAGRATVLLAVRLAALALGVLGTLGVAGCSASLETSPGVVRSRDHLAGLAPDRWAGATVDGPADPARTVSFGDPTLEALVREVLEANPDLKAAAARVAMAEADAAIAGADLYPSLEAGGAGGRQRQVFVGFPVDDPSLPSPLSATFTRLGVSLDLSWELDVWGRLRAGKDAAGADLEAARATLAGARLSLAAQAAKAWFALLEAHEQVELAERTVDSWTASAEQVEARYRSGVRSPLDVRLSRTQVAGAQARVAIRRAALGRVARQFEVLLGRYPSAELVSTVSRSSQTLEAWPVPPPLPAGVPLDVIGRRPDLVEAAQKVFAADRRIDAAKASLLPRIALTGSTGTVSDDFTHLLDGDFGVWSWAGNFLQPVFEGGRLRGAVRKSKAAADAAAETYVSRALVAFGEVENALADEGWLTSAELALERASVEAGAAERLAGERYRSGIEGYVTLLESRRASLEADSALLDARRRRLENRVDLLLALGGGLDDTAQSATAPTPGADAVPAPAPASTAAPDPGPDAAAAAVSTETGGT